MWWPFYEEQQLNTVCLSEYNLPNILRDVKFSGNYVLCDFGK